MTIRARPHTMGLVALLLAATAGIGKMFRGDHERTPDEPEWKRKKWRKPASHGPGGPAVRMRIPRKRSK